jgi:NAD(P)H-quinone oxidoreductase subunit J
MTETNNTPENIESASIIQAGATSQWLTENGFDHESLEKDHLGIELIKVEPDYLIPISTALYAYGFNYLQCQGAYDLGAGKELVSFYHLIKVADNVTTPEEVRIKVYLDREDPRIPSLYWI